MSTRKIARAYELDFLTMLREPTERLTGEFIDLVKAARVDDMHMADDFLPPHCAFSWDNRLALPCGLDHDMLLRREDVQQLIFNRQTKMLAGVGPALWEDVYETAEAMLETAKHNLQLFSWFGIYNRLDESVALLKCTFGEFWDKTWTNYTLEPIDGSPWHYESFSAIRAANMLDVKLLQFANQLFDRRLQEAQACPHVAALELAPRLVVSTEEYWQRYRDEVKTGLT